jgi:hypothetical protein
MRPSRRDGAVLLAHFEDDALDDFTELLKADPLDDRPHELLPVGARVLFFWVWSPTHLAAPQVSIGQLSRL